MCYSYDTNSASNNVNVRTNRKRAAHQNATCDESRVTSLNCVPTRTEQRAERNKRNAWTKSSPWHCKTVRVVHSRWPHHGRARSRRRRGSRRTVLPNCRRCGDDLQHLFPKRHYHFRRRHRLWSRSAVDDRPRQSLRGPTCSTRSPRRLTDL